VDTAWPIKLIVIKHFIILAKIFSGEDKDPDSGLSHRLHVAVRQLMGICRDQRKIIHPEILGLNLNMGKYNRDPKDFDDNNCLDINEAVQKYKGVNTLLLQKKKKRIINEICSSICINFNGFKYTRVNFYHHIVLPNLYADKMEYSYSVDRNYPFVHHNTDITSYR